MRHRPAEPASYDARGWISCPAPKLEAVFRGVQRCLVEYDFHRPGPQSQDAIEVQSAIPFEPLCLWVVDFACACRARPVTMALAVGSGPVQMLTERPVPQADADMGWGSATNIFEPRQFFAMSCEGSATHSKTKRTPAEPPGLL